MVTTKDGCKRNGNLLFTIRPIHAALQQDYDRQMQKLTEDAKEGGNMLILLRTQVDRTAKTPIPACHARVGSLCDFQDTVERVPAGSPKTGRCAAVRERWQKTSEQDEMAAGKAACSKCGKTLKMVKIEGFWTPRRESGEKAARKDKAAGSCAPQ